MGADEFNPDSIVGQTDGGNRDFDDGAEALGATFAAVGDAQREFANRIAELEQSVGEYAQIVAERGESRTQRAKVRSSSVARSGDGDSPEVGSRQAGADDVGNPTVEDGNPTVEDGYQAPQHRESNRPQPEPERYRGMEL